MGDNKKFNTTQTDVYTYIQILSTVRPYLSTTHLVEQSLLIVIVLAVASFSFQYLHFKTVCVFIFIFMIRL